MCKLEIWHSMHAGINDGAGLSAIMSKSFEWLIVIVFNLCDLWIVSQVMSNHDTIVVIFLNWSDAMLKNIT